MTLLQVRLVDDWKLALKNKDPKKDALSMIITELKNRAIKDNVSVTEGRVCSDETALEVLQKMAKQRKEAIEAYEAAKRADLADKEQFELSVVESYLPKPLNDDELRSLVNRVIEEVQATSMKDMGKIMQKTLADAAGRADGKRVQAMVQQILGQR
ncbi:MAG TPA: GatB/YqeY domain-containing protein [Myxococcota bacterium]|nr:GatB/YqeY domain-containing protein [Myxococcota bacterium]